VDGNGRLGRLLITLLLCECGDLRRPLLYLSAFLKANRAEYYELLMGVRLDGAWEAWLEFFLSGVEGAATEGFATALRVRDVLAADAARVDVALGRKVYPRAVLDLLASFPRVSAGFVQQRLGCAPGTASSTLNDLVQIGVVQEVTGRERDKVYAYRRYLDALAPPTEGGVGAV
jgi:Fic family protein